MNRRLIQNSEIAMLILRRLMKYVPVLLLLITMADPLLAIDIPKQFQRNSELINSFESLDSESKKQIIENVSLRKTKSDSDVKQDDVDSVKMLEKKENDTTSNIEAIYFEERPGAFELDFQTIHMQKKGQVAFSSSDIATKNMQFGYDFFDNYSRNDDDALSVGGDYILGPKDEFVVNLWGKVEETIELEIDANGQVIIPKIGIVNLTGVRYRDLDRILRKRFSQNYVNFDISTALTKLRQIRVYLLGEVDNPGPYDISSLSTAVSALAEIGGVKKTGSLRRITLYKANGEVRQLDLYDFLLEGDRKSDDALTDGDTIFVPIIGDTISVKGALKRPAIFELKKRTSAYDAINYFGGGFTHLSYGKKVQIKRVEKDVERVLKDIESSDAKAMEAALKETPVQNGDIVFVDTINQDINNYVQIIGHVKRAGRYAYKKGLTAKELIQGADGFLPNALQSRVTIVRNNVRGETGMFNIDMTKEESAFELNDRDIVIVYSIQSIEGTQEVILIGEVEREGRYPFYPNMTSSDLLIFSGMLNKNRQHKVEVIRMSPNKKLEVMSELVIPDMFSEKDIGRIKLQRNDIVFVRKDRLDPLESFIKINLSGQVRFPGEYFIERGTSLASVINQAGGFTEHSFIRGIKLFRMSVKKANEEGNKIVKQKEQKRAIYDVANLNSLEGISNPEIINATRDVTIESKEPDGRLILNLTHENLFNEEASNIILEENDLIDVPINTNSVIVAGGVMRPAAYLTSPGKNAQYYISLSGGTNDYANLNKAYVVKANGEINKHFNIIESGDMIFIPEEPKLKTDWFSIIVEISKVVANFATAVAVVNAIQ